MNPHGIRSFGALRNLCGIDTEFFATFNGSDWPLADIQFDAIKFAIEGKADMVWRHGDVR